MCVNGEGYQEFEVSSSLPRPGMFYFCLFSTHLGAQRCVDQYSQVQTAVTEDLLEAGGFGETSKSSGEGVLQDTGHHWAGEC